MITITDNLLLIIAITVILLRVMNTYNPAFGIEKTLVENYEAREWEPLSRTSIYFLFIKIFSFTSKIK